MEEDKKNKEEKVAEQLQFLLNNRYHCGIKVGLTALADMVLDILNSTDKALLKRVQDVKNTCNNAKRWSVEEISSFFDKGNGSNDSQNE